MPSPGGGSSAALCAAMAASLISMACHFTLGRKDYKKFERDIRKILKKSDSCVARLAALFDKDIEAYKAKDLKASIAVPGKVAFLSYELLKLIDELLVKGNKNLFSDLLQAAALAEGSYVSCFYYVRLNCKTASFRALKYQKLEDELARLLKKVKSLRKKTEVKVGKIIGR